MLERVLTLNQDIEAETKNHIDDLNFVSDIVNCVNSLTCNEATEVLSGDFGDRIQREVHLSSTLGNY